MPEVRAAGGRVDAGVDASCGGAGVETLRIEHGGDERRFRLAVPERSSNLPMPLVFDFHGAGVDGALQARVSGFEALGASEGFLVVTPDGLGNRWSASDVDFVDALINYVSERSCVDPQRVFAAGMSNGGFFSSILACERPNQIAAIATVTGISFPAGCEASGVAVIHFHGDDDEIVGFGPIPERVEQWARANGCGSEPTVAAVTSEVEHRTYTECTTGAPVSFYVVSGGGHSWPGSATTRDLVDRLGYTTMDINATELAWSFFQAAAETQDQRQDETGAAQSWSFTEAETASGMRYRVARRGAGDGTLLLHLHGATQSWASLRSDVEALADMIDRSSTTDAVVIVAPHDRDGWGMWVDSADGSNDIASRVLDDLVPQVEAEFGAGGSRDRRVLSGFSMGGFGAATLGLSDPLGWRAVGVWDGAMHTWVTLNDYRSHIAARQFDNDADYFARWSPWSLAEQRAGTSDVASFFVAHGSVPDFIDDYASHLRKQDIEVLEVDTRCGHNMTCLTREAGADFMTVTFDSFAADQ